MIRAALLLAALAFPAAAQEDAPAAVISAGAQASRGGDLRIELALDRAVPWRAQVAADPWRLIVDTSEVDWTGLDWTGRDGAALSGVGEVRTGRLGPGWSRLVVTLPVAMRIGSVWMSTDGAPVITVALEQGEGVEAASVPDRWAAAPVPVPVIPRPRQDGTRPLVIALDPGHGGVDSGAERGGVTEAALMLRFARELAEVLRRDGHRVVLTREGDQFVGLRGRGSVARAAGADLMISLHADAVEGGGASGATVYTLSEAEGDALTAEIARRQARDDLLLGVEVAEPGDEIARILVDLARVETAPRSDALASALVAGLAQAGLALHKRPRLGARFTVLKAPDIPTVLLELGFMSDPQDLTDILSPDWRGRMAAAIARGIEAWAPADAAEAARLRH